MTFSEIERALVKRAKAEHPKLAKGKGDWRVTSVWFEGDSVKAHIAYAEKRCTAYLNVTVGKSECL